MLQLKKLRVMTPNSIFLINHFFFNFLIVLNETETNQFPNKSILYYLYFFLFLFILSLKLGSIRITRSNYNCARWRVLRMKLRRRKLFPPRLCTSFSNPDWILDCSGLKSWLIRIEVIINLNKKSWLIRIEILIDQDCSHDKSG